MTPYTAEEEAEDDRRTFEAYDALVALQKEYEDIIAIPEVISIRDVVEYRLNTEHGIKQFKEVYSRNMAERVLRVISEKNFVTPAIIENAIVTVLLTNKEQ
jgi:hypothetical protein